MKRSYVIVLLLLTALSVASVVWTLRSTAPVVRDQTLPPYTYSNVLAGLLAFLCLSSIPSALKFDRKGSHKEERPKDRPSSSILLTALCAVFYVVGLRYVGFYVSTFFCMIVLHLNFENWRVSQLPRAVLFGLGLCTVFYVVFSFLRIYIPDGWLF